MPNFEAHEEAATRNQTVLDCLLTNYGSSPYAFAQWIITVAFYKALHLVEGIFYMDGLLSRDKRPFHSKDHKERNQRLKEIKRFEHIWKNYRPLFEASMVARYLVNPQTGQADDLTAYIPDDVIRSKFVGHYLLQIEKSFQTKKADYEKMSPASG